MVQKPYRNYIALKGQKAERKITMVETNSAAPTFLKLYMLTWK